MSYVDMSDFPADVYASAQKFEAWSFNHDMPSGKDAWLGLATAIGIPQDHLEMILARIWGQSVKRIRKIFKKARH